MDVAGAASQADAAGAPTASHGSKNTETGAPVARTSPSCNRKRPSQSVSAPSQTSAAPAGSSAERGDKHGGAGGGGGGGGEGAAKKKPRLTRRQMREDPIFQQFLKFRTELNRCSATNDCPGAVAVFNALGRHPDVVCNGHMYAMMLALCAKAGDLANGRAIFSRMQTQGLQPGEVVYSSMVKLFSDAGNLTEARRMFDTFLATTSAPSSGSAPRHQSRDDPNNSKKKNQGGKGRQSNQTHAPPSDKTNPLCASALSGTGRVKLRTLVPLFQAYAEACDIAACEELRRLLPTLELDANEAILRALVDVYALKCLQQQATVETDDLSDEKREAIGRAVSGVLAEMQENILSIGEKTRASLTRWFLEASPEVGTTRCWRVGVCEPDQTGLCKESGCRLTRIYIHPAEYVELAGQIEKLVVRGSEKRARQWTSFKKFCSARAGKYDVFIDGANVGFYGQNKGGVCRINIPQIGVAVEHWVAAGRRPLIVLHRHHRLQNRNQEHLFADWERRGLLYTCEKGNNDDWYWLWAAVETRDPNSLLISNDEMKDHHFNMLRPKHFQRWKIRHQTRFHFSWSQGSRRVDFFPPAIFTRCIQSHHKPLETPTADATTDPSVAGVPSVDSSADAVPSDTSAPASDSGKSRGPVIAWHFPLRDPPVAAHAQAAGSCTSLTTAATLEAAKSIGRSTSKSDDPSNSVVTAAASVAVSTELLPQTSSTSVAPRFRPRAGGVPAVEADAGGFQGATRWFFAKRVEEK